MMSSIVLFIVVSSVHVYVLHANQVNAGAHIAAGMLPDGIRACKQKSAAHGFDPEAVYGSIEGGNVKAYRPALFEKLRGHCMVSEQDFLCCLEKEALQCLNSDSKSGQAFWVSTDGKLVVKTIKHYEAKTLRRLLDSYALHVLSGPSTLGNVLGLYRVRGRFPGSRYVLVSKNVFPAPHVSGAKFDLKGSTVGRLAGASSAVAKDLNILQSGKQLQLGAVGKAAVLEVLARDTEWLAKWRLMDYSLLVAVETARDSPNSGRFSSGGQGMVGCQMSTAAGDGGKLVLLSPASSLIFHMGIIDFLQTYDCRKLLEHFFKSLYCDGKRISCVAPKYYAKRMLEFIAGITA